MKLDTLMNLIFSALSLLGSMTCIAAFVVAILFSWGTFYCLLLIAVCMAALSWVFYIDDAYGVESVRHYLTRKMK